MIRKSKFFIRIRVFNLEFDNIPSSCWVIQILLIPGPIVFVSQLSEWCILFNFYLFEAKSRNVSESVYFWSWFTSELSISIPSSNEHLARFATEFTQSCIENLKISTISNCKTSSSNFLILRRRAAFFFEDVSFFGVNFGFLSFCFLVFSVKIQKLILKLNFKNRFILNHHNQFL